MNDEHPGNAGTQNTDPADAAPPVSLLPLEGLSTFGGVGAPSSPIYRHGYSVRVALLLSKADAVVALAKAGYDPSGKDWKGKNATKTLRGTAWLTGRAPRNPNLPLSKSNRAWGTNLYGLAVEERPTGYFLDLSGVRFPDINKVCKTVMGLESDAYTVSYYRRAEAFVVLAPQDAYTLADALQGSAAHGKGRLARKSHLANIDIPMTIGKRTKANATLRIYRIKNGATNAFKVEIALEGRRMDRSCFTDADVAKLTQTLTDMCNTHGLQPMRKPSRWEPRSPEDQLAHVPFDPNMQKMPSAAWRGNPIEDRLIANCHTPVGLKLANSPCDGGSYPAGTRIRNEQDDSSPSLKEGTPTTPTLDDDDSTNDLNQGGSPSPKTPKGSCWTELADELTSLKGSLSEVILDGNQDPTSILEALNQDDPNMAISILKDGNLPTWATVEELAYDHRGNDESKTWAVVVDPSILGTVQDNAHVYDPNTRVFLGEIDPYVDPDTGEIFDGEDPAFEALPGPCCRHPNELVSGSWRSETRAVAAVLSPLLAQWRDLCERSGINIILISVDCRPDHGKGDLTKSHFFRDSRVRSLLGDAGRYYCHQRYLVEPNGGTSTYKIGPDGLGLTVMGCTVTTIKDEAEGKTGRIVYKPNPWGTGGKGYGRHSL